MERKRLMIAGGVVIVVVIVLGAAFFLFSGSSNLPTSTNVSIDPVKSSCKNTTTFTCTIVLDAKQGSVSASDVKSVSINGTSTQPTMTATGSSVTIVASFPTATGCVFGCPPSAATNTIPHVGAVVVDLSDGTSVSANVGFSGIV
jgi:hypothetical protein